MRWFNLLTLTILLGCSIDRTIEPLSDSEQLLLQEFLELPSDNQLQIASDTEPGERLILCLTITRKEDGSLIKNQRVKLYHTNVEGEYQPAIPSDESSARLSGWVTTDENGKAFVETILPGDYGSSADNRHIHTTVTDARPEGYDIHFKQYTGYMGKNFISGSDQHFLADLKQSGDGTLITFLTIAVKNRASE